MSRRLYVLDGHTPRRVDSFLEWGMVERGLGSEAWRVAFTDFGRGTVSTVFLGVDHNYSGIGPPLLFETMVFANEDEMLGGEMQRYATWDEAVAGHDEMVERCSRLRVVGGRDFERK